MDMYSAVVPQLQRHWWKTRLQSTIGNSEQVSFQFIFKYSQRVSVQNRCGQRVLC